jgi:hypothetical protein
MKSRFYSAADGWSAEGPKITSPEVLSQIRDYLDNSGPIIVEHRLYRGSSAPDRLIFDDFDSFHGYLNSQAFAGDAIHVWGFEAVCSDDNRLAHGKCPDDNGMVPKGGAY